MADEDAATMTLYSYLAQGPKKSLQPQNEQAQQQSSSKFCLAQHHNRRPSNLEPVSTTTNKKKLHTWGARWLGMTTSSTTLSPRSSRVSVWQRYHNQEINFGEFETEKRRLYFGTD